MKLCKESVVLPQTYSVPQEATEVRDLLIESAQMLQSVTDAASQIDATDCGRDIHRHLMEVEEARKLLSAPLRKALDQLIALSKTHCAPLVAEKDRLSALVSQFQTQEAERVRLEQEARAAEIARLEREHQQALEAAKMAQDASQAAGDMEQAMADINAAQAELAASAAESAAYTAIVAPLPAATKANGASTRMELCWEVTDLALLYASRPDLCKPPEPKSSAIKAVCTDKSVVPGLRLWGETRTNFRR